MGTVQAVIRPGKALYTDLYAVSAVDEENAWAVGRKGAILHTTDGGSSWKRQDSGVNCTLTSISSVSNRVAWAIGAGIILRTVDGGATWHRQSSEIKGNAISAVSARTAWIAGKLGIILKTIDGGKSWMNLNPATREKLRSISAIDEYTAWAAGNNGTLIHTTDGGEFWRLEKPEKPISVINEVYVLDENTAWAVGSGIIKTTDRGENWVDQDLGGLFFSVCACSAEVAWVVGRKKTIYKTADGGKTWMKQESWKEEFGEPRGYCQSISAIDANTAWVVGGWIRIAKTLDGGCHWFPQYNLPGNKANRSMPGLS